jgi:hypothetical protein
MLYLLAFHAYFLLGILICTCNLPTATSARSSHQKLLVKMDA